MPIAACDNEIVYVPTGYVNQSQLADAVTKATQSLDPREVRDVRFTIGSDAQGQPSIFFAILLTAHAVQKSRFADVTGRVAGHLFDEIQSFNRWGLQPYFNFTDARSHFKNPGWM